MKRCAPLLFVLTWPALVAAQGPEPPNVAATVRIANGGVTLAYGGATILDATLESTGAAPDVRRLVETAGGGVTQVLKWTAARGTRLTLTGTVHASAEAFAVEVEPREDALPVVRHASGPVTNLLNRAVYDRHSDWVLSIDFPATAEVVPSAGGFRITATGSEIALRFRPRYYQRHRGLTEYRPWMYRVWEFSVAGWTSWYAFFDKVTEQDVKRTANVLGDVLRPFGYRYLQIDDGYQRLPIGVPDYWLQSNEKFPGGLASLLAYISDRGLEAGIWTNVSFQDPQEAEAHPAWFVRTPDGRPARGNWVGFVMDGSSRETLATLVTPVYRALKDMGWAQTPKLDALRHLRYEGYNSFADYFARKGLDREQVFRGVVSSVRDTIGRDRYLLACWGIRPELIGLVDGMRVGDDGFGYGLFAEYNSFNNVVWRNDPDHIELRQPDGYRAATLTSLTGSVLMLTDLPEVYRTARAEAARRTAPVLFTRPGQIYDVDPSRSARIGEAGATLSGAGPRPFDADQRLVVPRYQLDIARPFEQWTVLARTEGSEPGIDLADLGLPSGKDYVAFEFWTHASLGIVRDRLALPAIDPAYQVQVVCLRPRVDHPQLLSTNRHVTCGGPDLSSVTWSADLLAGASDLVGGDEYVLYLTEPQGFTLDSVRAEGAEVAGQALEGGTRVIRLRTATGGTVRWTVRYRR